MERKELENRMGKFVRDFRIYTETSGSVDYKVLRNGLRMFIQAELDRAREEGKREVLTDIWDISTTERAKDINWCGDIIAEWADNELSKLTTK